MKRTQIKIRALVDSVDRGEIRLPEIQRAYAWKPPKVAGLLDSLYRGYPTGSILLWEPDAEVVEREAAIEGPNQAPLTLTQYLIDGQQRLTSLHRVFNAHDQARIVFNVESEKFQNESASTKQVGRWLRVHEVVADQGSMYCLITKLKDKLPGLDPDVVAKRIERLRGVADREYYVEVLTDLPYEEVTEIFVRVNSRGERLRGVDLALATLSARWPGVIAKLEAEAAKWSKAGYPKLNVAFLARCLAALGTKAGSVRGFASASTEELEKGWEAVKHGVEYLVTLLKNNADMTTGDLITSENALVPMVAFLAAPRDKPLEPETANALIYWMFAAFILARYSGSSDTVLAQDLTALRSAEPLRALFKNLGVLGEGVRVSDETLVGRTSTSPYFLLSYLAARRRGAKDWWYGADIGTDPSGVFQLQYHHVHPRARLRDTYSKAEINDLANLAFISDKANLKISSRDPAEYFDELGDEQLAAHFVPLEPSLRTVERYRDFVRERRLLLAAAMNELLDSFSPSWLTEPGAEDPAVGERLTPVAYAGATRAQPGSLVVTALADGVEWRASTALDAFKGFISDLENQFTAGLSIGGEDIVVEAGAEHVQPLGPLLVRGTIEEWREVLNRELRDIEPPDTAPKLADPQPWQESRTAFPIVDSE